MNAAQGGANLHEGADLHTDVCFWLSGANTAYENGVDMTPNDASMTLYVQVCVLEIGQKF